MFGFRPLVLVTRTPSFIKRRPASAQFRSQEFKPSSALAKYLEKGNTRKTQAWNLLSRSRECIAPEELQRLDDEFERLNGLMDALLKGISEFCGRSYALERQAREYKKAADRFETLVQNAIRKHPRLGTPPGTPPALISGLASDSTYSSSIHLSPSAVLNAATDDISTPATQTVQEDQIDHDVEFEVHIIPPTPAVSESHLSSASEGDDFPATPTSSNFSHDGHLYDDAFHDPLNQTAAWCDDPNDSPTWDSMEAFPPLLLFKKDSPTSDADDASTASNSPLPSPVDEVWKLKEILHEEHHTLEITHDIKVHIDSTFSLTRASIPENVQQHDEETEELEHYGSFPIDDVEDDNVCSDSPFPYLDVEDEDIISQPPSPYVKGDDGEVQSTSSGSSDNLLDELKTSEIVVATPLSSARAEEIVIPPTEFIDPAHPEEPQLFIDRAFEEAGIDIRPYWPALDKLHQWNPSKVQKVQEALQAYGPLPALKLLNFHCQDMCDVGYIPRRSLIAEPLLNHTAKLVWQSDQFVTEPRRPAAPENAFADSLERLHGDLAKLYLPTEQSISNFGEEEDWDDDAVSVRCAPFGPSRSNTLDAVAADVVQDASDLPPPEHPRPVEEVLRDVPRWASRSAPPVSSIAVPSRPFPSPQILALPDAAWVRKHRNAELSPQLPIQTPPPVYDEPVELPRVEDNLFPDPATPPYEPVIPILAYEPSPRIHAPQPIHFNVLISPLTGLGNTLGLLNVPRPVSQLSSHSEPGYSGDRSFFWD